MADHNILVKLGANIREFQSKMSEAQDTVRSFSERTKSIGDAFTDIGGAATKAMTPVYALGGAVGALGLKRIMDAERVGIMFDTIYDSASDAEQAMEGVLDLVRGTRYGINEIADPFAQLKSTGVEDATAQMAMLANMNLASMKGDSSMVQRLTELQQAALAMGRFDGQMINRFATAFVDVPVLVGNALNMTRDQARDFLSDGAYDVEEIMNIISDGILNGSEGIAGEMSAMGGMIDAEGQTLSGRWANLKAAMGRAGEEIWEESGAFDRLKDVLADVTEAFDNSSSAFVPAAKAITDAIANVFEVVMRVVTWFTELDSTTQSLIANIAVGAAAFGPFLLIIGQILKTLSIFTPILGLVKGAISGVSAIVGLAAGKFLLIVAAIAAVVAGLIWAYNNVEWFRDAVDAVWDAIVTAAQAAFNWLMDVINFALDFVRGLWDEHGDTIIGIATTVWDGIVDAIEAAINFAQEIIEKVLGYVQDIWDEHGEFITETAKKTWENIQTAIETATNLISDVISVAMDLIEDIFNTAWPVISEIVEVAWEAIKTAVESAVDYVAGVIDTTMKIMQGDWEGAWETIQETAQKIWDNIVDFFESVDLVQVGKDIIDGLISGIRSMGDSVKNAVENLASSLPNWIKKVLGIASPSKVLAKLGEWSGMGMVKGIESTTKLVSKATRGLADAAVPDERTVDMNYATPSGANSGLARDIVTGIGESDTYQLVNAERMFDGANISVAGDYDVKRMMQQAGDFMTNERRRAGLR